MPLAAVAADAMPLTARAVKVPKLVMLGCAAVAKVPVMVPDTERLFSVPRLVMLGCAAVASVPDSDVAETEVAATDAAFTAPETDSDDKVPTLVMLG